MQPTEEQTAVVDASLDGEPLKVDARAGAGKTSTLGLVSTAKGRARGVYLAFNRLIAEEAKRKFPLSVRCGTVNSQAYRSVSADITRKLRNPLEPNYLLAERFGLQPIKVPTTIGKNLELTSAKLGRMVRDGLARFCGSAKPTPLDWHIPVDPLITEQAAEALRHALLPSVVKLWEESQNPRSPGAISHDVYVKLWQLSRPTIPADYILFDESQDANGLMLSVLRRQSAQVIYVGDPYQQIYEWRGAVNAMDHIKAQKRALTLSFRFGEPIAALATRILRTMDEEVPVRGQASIASRIHKDISPSELKVNAVLCRKNATVLSYVADGLQRGEKVAIRANIRDIMAFLDCAERLMCGQRTDYPTALSLFANWSEVQDYADSFAGRDLKPFVKLIDDEGIPYVRQLLSTVSPESEADYVVSTIHQVKGLEYDSVRIAGDFRFKTDDDGKYTMDTEEKRLLYVALTRAKRNLDITAIQVDMHRMFRDAGV